MDFEYDPQKSNINRGKHGIDFAAAQELWNDPDLLEIPARTVDEPCDLVIGETDGKYCSAVITYRTGRTRLISVRLPWREEIELYES